MNQLLRLNHLLVNELMAADWETWNSEWRLLFHVFFYFEPGNSFTFLKNINKMQHEIKHEIKVQTFIFKIRKNNIKEDITFRKLQCDMLPFVQVVPTMLFNKKRELKITC